MLIPHFAWGIIPSIYYNFVCIKRPFYWLIPLKFCAKYTVVLCVKFQTDWFVMEKRDFVIIEFVDGFHYLALLFSDLSLQWHHIWRASHTWLEFNDCRDRPSASTDPRSRGVSADGRRKNLFRNQWASILVLILFGLVLYMNQWVWPQDKWLCMHSRVENFAAFHPSSVFGLSQWESTLHCNVVSHWLSPLTQNDRCLPPFNHCRVVITCGTKHSRSHRKHLVASIFSYPFCGMKNYVFCFKFNWSLLQWPNWQYI